MHIIKCVHMHCNRAAVFCVTHCQGRGRIQSVRLHMALWRPHRADTPGSILRWLYTPLRNNPRYWPEPQPGNQRRDHVKWDKPSHIYNNTLTQEKMITYRLNKDVVQWKQFNLRMFFLCFSCFQRPERGANIRYFISKGGRKKDKINKSLCSRFFSLSPSIK